MKSNHIDEYVSSGTSPTCRDSSKNSSAQSVLGQPEPLLLDINGIAHALNDTPWAVRSLLIGTYNSGKVRFTAASPVLNDQDEVGFTAEPVVGEFTTVPLRYRLDDGTPLTVLNPQPPPQPVENAELYDLFFIDSFFYKSKAKTEAGQQNAYQKMKQMRAASKAEYREGNEQLQKAHFNKHSRSVNGAIDPRDTCPRCGCQVFVPFGKQTKKREKLRCKDCGYQLRSKFHEPTKVEEISSTDRNQLAGVPNRVDPPKVKARMSKQDFVARLRQSGMLQDAQSSEDLDPEERRKLTGSYLQIVDSWTADDVRGLHGYEDECTDVASPDGCALLPELLPPARSATTNCLAC